MEVANNYDVLGLQSTVALDALYPTLCEFLVQQPCNPCPGAAIVTPENSICSNADRSNCPFVSDQIDLVLHEYFNDIEIENVIVLGSKAAKHPPGVTLEYRRFKRDVFQKRQKISEDKLNEWVYPELIRYLHLNGKCTNAATIDDVHFFQKQPKKSSYSRLIGSDRDSAIIKDIRNNNIARNKASNFDGKAGLEHFIVDAKVQLQHAQSDVDWEVYQLFHSMLCNMESIATPSDSLIEHFKRIFKMNFKWFFKRSGNKKLKSATEVTASPPVVKCEEVHGETPSVDDSSMPHGLKTVQRSTFVRNVSSLSQTSVQDLETVVPSNLDASPTVSSSKQNDALESNRSIRDWNVSERMSNAAFCATTTSDECNDLQVDPIDAHIDPNKGDEDNEVYMKKRKECDTSDSSTLLRSNFTKTIRLSDTWRFDGSDPWSSFVGAPEDEICETDTSEMNDDEQGDHYMNDINSNNVDMSTMTSLDNNDNGKETSLLHASSRGELLEENLFCPAGWNECGS